MSESFDYSLFGLRLRSALPLPELDPAQADGLADVDILPGDVALPEGKGQEPRPINGGAVIDIEGIARFAVLNGSTIIIQPMRDAAERNVRLYLLGSAMGLLIHQRGLLPLHANAVEVGGKAMLFMGQSGAGKSTLAAWFHDQGFRVIADDVSVVRFDKEGRAVASEGLPRLRLWRDALDASGRAPSDYQRSYSGDETYEKFDVPMARDGEAGPAVPVGAIYVLARACAVEIEPLVGLAAAEAVFANTYRGQYLNQSNGRRLHWEACLKLIATVPIFRADRQWDLALLDRESRSLLAHADNHSAA